MVYKTPIRSDELYHHGIKGQRWGVRRFQELDGTYTMAGRKRYKLGERMNMAHPYDSQKTHQMKSDYNNLTSRHFKKKYSMSKNRYRKDVNKYGDPHQTVMDNAKMSGKTLAARAANTGANIGILALGVYGAKNFNTPEGKAAMAASVGAAIAKKYMKTSIKNKEYLLR